VGGCSGLFGQHTCLVTARRPSFMGGCSGVGVCEFKKY
jgi:hypothetical protein